VNDLRPSCMTGRREEEYAILGANVMIKLNSESPTRQATTRAWAITRGVQRTPRALSQRRELIATIRWFCDG
jgi:hypothetical protein